MQRRHLLVLLAATSLAGAAVAQSYPTKPIRLVVPFAPGGTTDIIARVVAEPLARELGRPVVVENKAGAGGAIGATEVMRAAPDGYTLGLATASTTATNPAINDRIGYDPVADFASIINIAATPNVLAVNAQFPAQNHDEFLSLLKREPGEYSYASPGTGSIGHLQVELYKSLTGTFITHIPYRGAAPALNDVVGGQLPIILDNVPSALSFIKTGRLHAIAVTAPQRLKELPDTPTFGELGLDPVNRMAYYGLVAPKDTPVDIIARLNEAANKVLQDPVVRKRIEDTGSLIVAGSPGDFARQIADELDTYRDVVRRQNLAP